MTSCRKLAGTTALATLMMAQSALADVTPQQVWTDFKGYLEGYGYTINGTEAMSGDTLTVSDINMTVPLPEEEGTITMAMSEMVFEADGGAVDVSWPAEMPVDLTIMADGETVEVGLLYKTEGLDMTVSGDVDDTTWDFAASSLVVSLNKLVVEGETIPRDNARGQLAMNGVTSRSAMATGDLRNITQEMAIEQLTYDVAAQDPDNPENNMLIKGGMNGVSYRGTGALPKELDPEDPAAIFRAGFDVSGTFGYESGESQFNFVDRSESMAFQSSSEGGGGSIAMNGTSWSYDYLVRGLDLQVAGSEVPFPVSLKASEFGGGVTMPVSKTEVPQDVAMSVNLSDFQMNDMIWQIFDPSAQLPRDPATIAIDLTGKARMLFDIFDPEQAEMMEDAEMPAELHEVTLNSLMVKAVGAMLTGNGAFTFDNSDLQTFGGMPRPQGELNAELTGGNALIDKLIAMGLLPEEEAMGFRMMMSMFTVAKGDDVLSSKIEVNEQGHVLANGQRIQ